VQLRVLSLISTVTASVHVSATEPTNDLPVSWCLRNIALSGLMEVSVSRGPLRVANRT
jgi:hypothetical protein